MYVQKRTSFFRQPSAWQQMETQRVKSRQWRSQYESTNSALSSLVTSASTDSAYGAGNLAAKAAVARIQAETAKKVEANQKAAAANASVYQNKTPATEVSEGDTKVNFSANTITLSDGTVLDIKTGVKKVNVVT